MSVCVSGGGGGVCACVYCVYFCACASMYAYVSKHMLFKRLLHDSVSSIHIISPMKQQFIVTYTIPQTEIPALLHNWVTNTPCVKILYTHTHTSVCLYFRKNMMCLIDGMLSICQVYSVFCQTVYCWSAASCSFMSDLTYNNNNRRKCLYIANWRGQVHTFWRPTARYS